MIAMVRLNRLTSMYERLEDSRYLITIVDSLMMMNDKHFIETGKIKNNKYDINK